MTELAEAFWDRAKDALRAAKHVLVVSPNTAASRSYYAAFYAVSAYFALTGRAFKKHSSVEAAVHRDLVKTGLWPKELGAEYSVLVELRSLSDYGALEQVSGQEACDATEAATDILTAVARAHPSVFTGLEND